MREKDDLQALTVAVRIRPFSNAEVGLGCTDIAHSMESKMVVLMDPCDDQDDILRANRSREKQYVFDETFGPNSSQKEVYQKTTKVLIKSVMEGYNATVFAYGPTGAGKTYTMLGADKEPGIMVRTLNDLFHEMDNSSEDCRYDVTMSYLEIYNEMIRDLLNPSSGFLELREDAKGVVVTGLSEASATTTKEVMHMLVMGNKQRTCEPTAVNKTSSRSHAVLQVTVKQRSRVRNVVEEYRVGKLFMIDLAGSERASQTQNRGKRLIEGAHINRSLLALGNCINALCEKGTKGSQYINYRDSKLTRLLKDSLGGNCKTVMIAHISPASMCFEESRNTLNYADRAKNIKLKVKRNQYNVNYHIAQYQSIIAELRQEILRLKTKMAEKSLQVKEVSNSSNSAKACKESKQLNLLRAQLVSDFQTQMEIRRELVDLENETMQMSVEYQRNIFLVDEWEQEKAKRGARLQLKHAKRMREQEPQQIDDSTNTVTGQPVKVDIRTNVNEDPNDLWEPSDVIAAKEMLQVLSGKESLFLEKKTNLQDTLKKLTSSRSRLEDSLPGRITCEEHLEVLKLLCQVHELELKNAELESMSMLRDQLTQHKDVTLQKQEMKQKLCDEIIQCQRVLMEESEIDLPIELETLYQMYLIQMGDLEMNTYAATPNASMMNLQQDASRAGVAKGASSIQRMSISSISKATGHLSVDNHTPYSRRTRRKWADSLSDMESEEGLHRDAETGLYKANTMPFEFAHRETESTINVVNNASETDGHHAGDSTKIRKKTKVKKKKRKDKKSTASQDSRQSVRTTQTSRLPPSFASDPSLRHVTQQLAMPSNIRMAQSMSDLPDQYHSDSQNNDAHKEQMQHQRPRLRQRSSSLDMGKERMRLRSEFEAEAAVQQQQHEPSSPPKVTHQGDYTTFAALASPVSAVQQRGATKPGQRHKIHRQRIPGIDRHHASRARIGTHGTVHNSSHHSTKNLSELKPIDAKKPVSQGLLAVSGIAVTQRKPVPGIKRY